MFGQSYHFEKSKPSRKTVETDELVPYEPPPLALHPLQIDFGTFNVKAQYKDMAFGGVGLESRKGDKIGG